MRSDLTPPPAGGLLGRLRSLLPQPAPAAKPVPAEESAAATVALAARLKQFLDGREAILMATGVGPGDGTTAVAVGVCRALAALADTPILLVDFNFRAPALHRHFGLDRKPGLREVLAGAASLEQALQRTDLDNLKVLAAGEAGAYRQVDEWLGGEACARFFNSLRGRFPWVVVDAPPLVSSPDAAVLASRSDAVMLVAAKGRRNLGEVEAANNLLRVLNCNTLGIVLTQPPGSEAARHGE